MVSGLFGRDSGDASWMRGTHGGWSCPEPDLALRPSWQLLSLGQLCHAEADKALAVQVGDHVGSRRVPTGLQ